MQIQSSDANPERGFVELVSPTYANPELGFCRIS